MKAQPEFSVNTKVKGKGCQNTTGTVVDTSGKLIKVRHNEKQVAGQPFEGWGPKTEWEIVT